MAVLCGSMMLANIPQEKKTHPSWSNDPAEKSPWTPSALSRSYGHRRGWRLQVCIPFPWRLESTLVYLGRWWTVMDPYRATWDHLGMRCTKCPVPWRPPLFSALVSLRGRAGTGAWDESIDGWLPLAGALHLHGPLGPGKACRLASLKVLGVTKDQQRDSIFLYSNHVIFACYLMHFLLSVLHASGAFTIMAEYDVTADLAPLCTHSETVIRHWLASKHANKQTGITLFGRCIDMPSPTRTFKPVFRQYSDRNWITFWHRGTDSTGGSSELLNQDVFTINEDIPEPARANWTGWWILEFLT